jgi:integrase
MQEVKGFTARKGSENQVGSPRNAEPREPQNPPQAPEVSPGFRTESWCSAVDQYVRLRDSEGLIGERWVRRIRSNLLRLPGVWIRLGVNPAPSGPSEVTPRHLSILRDATGWERATVEFYFSSIRGFLRWAKNGISEEKTVWRLPIGVARRRRWLTKTQLLDLLHAAPRRARPLIALEGFNGLRRIEVLRLRVQDVNLSENLLNILGKGRMGGKWRQIPLQRMVRTELMEAMVGKNEGDQIMPFSSSGADNLLQSAAEAARFGECGVKVSHHDLRRSFGRLAHAAGMDLIQLKNLYGHASMDMTVHYVGIDLDQMRSGLDQFDRYMGREPAG